MPPEPASVHPVTRFALVGSTVMGVVGAVVGLVLGVRAYPPTAWFAVVEVAVPAALAGAVLGALAGLAVSRLSGRRTPRDARR